ncbi:SLAM family member 5-like [Elgaria multicarinata webbii]|uniref:SLAM family member 5-like n=1 Tax=Elgaria multicarinata webbii TaxID=159646 RepID=UPI002FCCBE19
MIVKCASSRSTQTVLLYGSFLCSLVGPVTNSELNTPVIGIRRGSIFLSVNESLAKEVIKIEWGFQPKNALAFNFAEFQNGKLEQTYSDQFEQRVEMANETTLRIKDLKMEDSGKYKARVIFFRGRYQDHTFVLTVYEPVPSPQIRHSVVSNTPDECNVTLQCEPFGREGLNVSWKRGNPLRPLEEDGLNWIQRSANSTGVHLTWQSGFSNSSIICLISNPAGQKSVSVELSNICKNDEQSPSGRMWLWYPAPVATIIFAAVLGIWTWKERRKTLSNTGDVSTLPKEKLPDLQYSEIRKSRSPPEGNEDQEPNLLSDENPRMKTPTVYAELQLPTHPSDQIT